MAIDKKAGAGANKKGKKGNKKMYVPFHPPHGLSPPWGTLYLPLRSILQPAQSPSLLSRSYNPARSLYKP